MAKKKAALRKAVSRKAAPKKAASKKAAVPRRRKKPVLTTGVATDIRFGSVTATGARANIGSDNWTVLKTATGIYKITFTGGMAAAPAVTVSSVADVNTWTTLQGNPTSTEVVIKAFDYIDQISIPAARDRAFSFIAICKE